MKEFKGKVAIITGATSAIGLALAERCAHEGMKIVLADLELESLARAEKGLAATGASILSVVTDVTKFEDIEELARKALEKFGAVDLLCNTSAVRCPAPLSQVTLADWKWVIDTNLYGVFYSLNVFLPIMFKQDSECHILNTSSILGGFYPMPFDGPYNVSEFGLETLTETLYLELATVYPKVKVSFLCPDYANAEILDSESRRPVRFSNTPGKETSMEAIPQFGKIEGVIRATSRAEMDAERLAAMAFEAITEERFYVFPHPLCRVLLRDRLEGLEQELNPKNILEMMGDAS